MLSPPSRDSQTQLSNFSLFHNFLICCCPPSLDKFIFTHLSGIHRRYIILKEKTLTIHLFSSDGPSVVGFIYFCSRLSLFLLSLTLPILLTLKSLCCQTHSALLLLYFLFLSFSFHGLFQYARSSMYFWPILQWNKLICPGLVSSWWKQSLIAFTDLSP